MAPSVTVEFAGHAVVHAQGEISRGERVPWAGLTLSYLIPKLPPSSAIIAVATGIYLLAFLATSDVRHVPARRMLTVIRGTKN